MTIYLINKHTKDKTHIMYDSIIETIIDAYEGDDTWSYEDEVIRRTTINDYDDNDEDDRQCR